LQTNRQQANGYSSAQGVRDSCGERAGLLSLQKANTTLPFADTHHRFNADFAKSAQTRSPLGMDRRPSCLADGKYAQPCPELPEAPCGGARQLLASSLARRGGRDSARRIGSSDLEESADSEPLVPLLSVAGTWRQRQETDVPVERSGLSPNGISWASREIRSSRHLPSCSDNRQYLCSKRIAIKEPQRAVNVKYYLTTDEIGPKLDPTRLEPRKGGKKGKKTHFYFIPQGATLTEEESVTVDETAVKGQSRSAAPAPKKKARKAAAASPGS
jgi:hypothetical protein